MRVLRTENLRNVSTEILRVKEFWGENYKECQYWAMTFFAYRKELRVAAWSKKFEICHSLSLEGGGPKPRNQPIHTPHFGELYA